MSPVVNQLWQVLESLGESSQFCTAGSLSPVLPGLDVEGIGNVGVPISAADARRLIERASQAPYGRGEQTIVDTNVRRVWQLEPQRFALRNAAWSAFMDGIVETVRKEFGIDKKVGHELYKLLIYEPGSFFAPHRDTEKTPGMFATLVVGLPSRHEGGTLIVTHDGETKRIDFGGDKSEFDIQYAAFYADCRHEMTPVTSGHRICLVYNLAITKQEEQPSAPVNSQAVDAIAEVLPQFFADDTLDKVVIPFKHQYTEAALDPRELKGADRSYMAVLSRAGERLGYQVTVALLTHHQSGSPDYNTISDSRSRRRYRRFDGGLDSDISGEDQDAQFEDVFEESRSLDGWVDPQGRQPPFGKMRFAKEEVVANDAEDAWLYTQEIHEATGNEGATMERWYHQAVVVIWPRERHFRILAGEGPEHAVPALEELAAATAEPLEDANCRAFATEIVGHWNGPKQSYPPPKQTSLTSRMLAQLDRMGAADLAVCFVHDVLPTDSDGNEGPVLARLGSRFGWQPLAKPLQQFLARQTPKDYWSKLAKPVTIFEGLCCSPPAMTDERRSVCIALADELLSTIERWDAGRDQDYYQRESRTGIVESVFRSFHALGESDRLEGFVTYVLGAPKRYELHEVLIPAVKAILAALVPGSPDRNSVDPLLQHCLAELRTATAAPIEPPVDWSRAANIDCKCGDCREMALFLRHPTEQVHKFPRRKELRQHLHAQIDKHRLDLTHVTLRTGSPQTLVCTKNQATYERRRVQFDLDVQLLNELEDLATAKTTRRDAPSALRRAKPKKGASAAPRKKSLRRK